MTKKHSDASQISCCCFDLETTNLSADFGVILCAVIKAPGQPPVTLRADKLNPRWSSHRSDDSHVTKAIVNELAKHDIWIAHNGAKFDVPFLRTRLLRWCLPPLPTRKLVDPVLLARNKLRLGYNSLDRVAEHLGCNSKTEVSPAYWLQAALDGNARAMNYITEHCYQDVLVLEKVVTAIKHYATTLNSWGSGF
jgi:uncharacterized protein YprB with RNaseH-like and TPR domain